MRILIGTAFSSCRTLHNLKRMSAFSSPAAPTAVTSSSSWTGRVSRSPIAGMMVVRKSSSDANKSKDEMVSADSGSAGGSLPTDSPAKQEEEEVLEEVTEVILKEIPDSKIHWEYQQDNKTAIVYDRKPIRIKCKEGRIYMWCACGMSRHQPFCDGTHKIIQFNITLKPIPWTCKKTGYYWFCNCKKSGKKVFCDGTHLQLMSDPNVFPTIKH